MIELIDGYEFGRESDLLSQMFQLRKRVFHDRLNWDVTVNGEFESDKYDLQRPLYVLSLDESRKRVLGSLRLHPTTGPTMLNDTFGALLPEGRPVRSPLIWESSRYCVDTEASERWASKGVHHTSAELLLALYEIGIAAGLEFIVSVIDLRIERIFRRLASTCERIGQPVQFGKVTAVAGLWETTEANMQKVREASGISDPVLKPNQLTIRRTSDTARNAAA